MAMTYDMLVQMMEYLDVDGDGQVTKDEFKLPYMKLFPKMTEEEFEETWKKIDTNGDGDLQFEELATYYGFSLDAEAKKSGSVGDAMTDEQIMEALQLQAAIYDARKEAEQAKKIAESGTASQELAADVKKRTTDAIKTIKLTADSNDASTQLLQACELGEKEQIKELIAKVDDKGQPCANVRIEDDKGQMPLHKLSRWGYVDVARSLLEGLSKFDPTNACLRCDINKADKSGKTPIFYAAEYGNDKMAKLLLDRGCDPAVENANGWTVLHTAVNSNKIEVVKVILEHRRVDTKKLCAHLDKTQRTVLHIASFKCEEEIVSLLLKNGADPMVADSGGNNAIKLATKTGRRRSREVLEAHIGIAPPAAAPAPAPSAAPA